MKMIPPIEKRETKIRQKGEIRLNMKEIFLWEFFHKYKKIILDISDLFFMALNNSGAKISYDFVKKKTFLLFSKKILKNHH